MYRVTITLKSGAFLEGPTETPAEGVTMDRVKRRLADIVADSNNALHLDLADGSWACVRTDCIEQVRIEEVTK